MTGYHNTITHFFQQIKQKREWVIVLRLYAQVRDWNELSLNLSQVCKEDRYERLENRENNSSINGLTGGWNEGSKQ